jgi:hypothetical protein
MEWRVSVIVTDKVTGKRIRPVCQKQPNKVKIFLRQGYEQWGRSIFIPGIDLHIVLE